MEVSLPQIINTKKQTKTACSSRLVVQYVIEKFCSYKGYFINFYQVKDIGN